MAPPLWEKIRDKMGCAWQDSDRCLKENATRANKTKWFVLPGTFTEAVKTQSGHFCSACKFRYYQRRGHHRDTVESYAAMVVEGAAHNGDGANNKRNASTPVLECTQTLKQRAIRPTTCEPRETRARSKELLFNKKAAARRRG
jgi:hypothetical protein